MGSALEVLNVARTQVGFIEGENNDNPFGVYYGMNHQPYCAMFVSWCFDKAGASALVAAQTSKGFAYCPAGLSWFQQKKQVIGKYDGQPGDIVFFSFAGNGVADHVEIIEAASRDGITTIGGNTSPDHALTASQANGNGVYRRHRPYLYVLAIVRPAYTPATTPSKSLGQNKTIASGVAATTALGGGAAAINHSSTPQPKPTAFVAPAFPGVSAFKVGNKSKAVLAVEKALAKAGLLPASMVDGLYTSDTAAAVIAYQKKHKDLKPADGIVGAKTYADMVKDIK